MKDEPKQANPAEGGSYVRDPDTGELVRVQEDAPGEQPAADQAPVQPEKGRGKRASEIKE